MDDIIKQVKFDKTGLVPAIIQDHRTYMVLMMAYMNADSLMTTINTGITHFFSRSRRKLWQKGETSGNIQMVKKILYDCDGDTLLVQVEQVGVACHTGNRSCFHRGLYEKDGVPDIDKSPLSGIVNKVFDVILERKNNPDNSSYVSSLYSAGVDKILKKIPEEAGELLISSKNNNRSEIICEAADLWFHTLVLLGYHGLTPQDVYKELEDRFGVSGFEKKKKEGKKK